MHVFLDTSTIVNGFVFSTSNSGIIIDWVKSGKIKPVVCEQVVLEVRRVLTRISNDEIVKEANIFIRSYCIIIPQKEVIQTMEQFRGQIKEKDLEQLAVVKQFAIPYLIAFDRDFEPFPEYFTPKQFVQKMGMQPFDTDY